MKPMEIYIADVPFDDEDDSKIRPALVVKVSDERVNIFKVTTKFKNKSKKIRRLYYPIKKWKESGLKELSYVDTHRTYNISQNAVFNRKPIGKLDNGDIVGLFEFIQKITKESKNV